MFPVMVLQPLLKSQILYRKSFSGHREIMGTYVMSSTAAKFQSMKGMDPLSTFSKGVLQIFDATKRSTPMGGVAIPRARFATMKVPK